MGDRLNTTTGDTGTGVEAAKVTEPGIGRALWQAALLFLAYSVIQVIVNGIVLDETVIAAQIIGGTTVYDAGHPHAVYYTQAFSLPHYLSAAAWLIHPSAAWISAIRNVFVLFLSLFAAFTLTLVVLRRALWGYVASALVIAEGNLRFDGLYPMGTFPMIYSNGNVGLHISILIVALLLGRMWRSSALLLGLLPSIHAMFAVILWPWALLVLLARRVYRDRIALRQVLVWGSLGVAVCAGLYVLIQLTADFRPPVAPYDVTADGGLIREQFRIWTDGHRRPIAPRGFGYLVNVVAFFVLCALLWSRALADTARSHSTREPVGWIILLGVMTWGYVYGTHFWLSIAGALPDWVWVTMPARFSNVSTALFPPLTAIALGGAVGALDTRKRTLALLVLGAFLLVGAFGDANLLAVDTRRMFMRNGLFVLWGILMAFEWVSSTGRRRGTVLTTLVALVAVLFRYWTSTHMAIYVVAAAVITVIVLESAARLPGTGSALTSRLSAGGGTRWLAPGMVLLFLAALPGRVTDARSPEFVAWSRQSDETRALGEWLKANADPTEPVLTVFIPNSELQVKTDQPVLFEQKTLWIMSYFPDLAPSIGAMARDLYGIDYENPESMARACDGGRVHIYCLAWNRAWQERTPQEWLELGHRYRFRLVLSATTLPLSLPVAVAGNRWTLYEIAPTSPDALAGGEAGAPK